MNIAKTGFIFLFISLFLWSPAIQSVGPAEAAEDQMVASPRYSETHRMGDAAMSVAVIDHTIIQDRLWTIPTPVMIGTVAAGGTVEGFESVTVIVELRDENGEIGSTSQTRVFLHKLRPGDVSPFRLDLKPFRGYRDHTFRVEYDRTMIQPERDVKIINHSGSLDAEEKNLTITGQVKNTGDRQSGPSEIICHGWDGPRSDETRQLAGVGRSNSDEIIGRLQPGEISDFSMTLRNTPHPVRYFYCQVQSEPANDAFERLILKNLIAHGDSFEGNSERWCFFKPCRQERARGNLARLMEIAGENSSECRVGRNIPMVKQLQDDPSLEMEEGLEADYKEWFDDFPESELSCQRMVETFHRDEIAKLNSREEFEEYVRSVCQPVADLRNCMLDMGSRWLGTDVTAVHDRVRPHAKWQDYRDLYEVHRQSGPVERESTQHEP